MKNKKQMLRFFLGSLLACCVAAGLLTDQVRGKNLKKYTEITVDLQESPPFTGYGVTPESFLTTRVFTDLQNEEKTELTGLPVSYSYYRYREDRPHGPDETMDKLHWDETPSQVGTYWVKAKFLGDYDYHPSSTDYFQFRVVPAVPRLELYTNMTEETRIGDTIVVTAEFQGVETEPEDFQPSGKAVFQAGGRFIDQAVDFYGNKAEVSYTLTAEPVDIKAEYVPGTDNENYARAEAVLPGILGRKQDQQPLVIPVETVAYGVEPYILSVTGGSGSGELTYVSGDEKIASVSEKGTITIHHPGTVELRVIKAADDTYAQAEAVCQLTVSKGINPQKPKLPVLMEAAENQIRIKETEGQEFSIDGGENWTADGIFKELKAKKKYTVITRLCETELYEPGKSTKFLQVTTQRQANETPGIPNTGISGSGGSSGNNSVVADSPEPGGGGWNRAFAPQKSQWNALETSKPAASPAASQEDLEETAREDRAKKEPERAKGKVKGSRPEQAEETPQEEPEEKPEEEKTEESEGNEEAEEENKIISTGTTRPKKKGIPLAALAGILAGAAAAAGASWAIKTGRWRRQYEKYRNSL